eukprot:148244_1
MTCFIVFAIVLSYHLHSTLEVETKHPCNQIGALDQMEQRYKILTFGYLRENERKNGLEAIPQSIKYLVTLFANSQDGFDLKLTAKELKIDGNTILYGSAYGIGVYNVYLNNIASEGIHIWRFKCEEIGRVRPMSFEGGFEQCCLIGIYKVVENDTFDEDEIGIQFIERDLDSYGMYNDAKISSSDDPFKNKKYGRKWKTGDIVEMNLDLTNKTLRYKINTKQYGRAFKIKEGEYKGALSFMSDRSITLSLLSYQEIYKK